MAASSDYRHPSLQILVQFWNLLTWHLPGAVPMVNDMLNGMMVDTESQDGNTIWVFPHELLQISL